MGSIPVSIAVGRSSDQRLQVIRGDMQTSWNFYTGSGDESVWVPWEPFPADGLPGSLWRGVRLRRRRLRRGRVRCPTQS